MYGIDFEKSGGLVPVIVQDSETNKVLMVAYTNEEAFKQTLSCKKAVFWSRSKGRLWQKGEQSGNYQEIIDILIDCDNDCLLYLVKLHGKKAACHTGHYSCFYRCYQNGFWLDTDDKKLFNPQDVYC